MPKKVRVPDTFTDYKVRVPDTFAHYRTRVPEGAAPTTGTVNVTMSEQTATWSISPDPDGLGPYTGDRSFVGADAGLYTVTFNDNLLAFTAPGQDSDTLVGGGTINLSGTYAARSTFNVNVATTEDGIGAVIGTWTIESDSHPAQFTITPDPGTDDVTDVQCSLGDFYTGRAYTLTFNAVGGYSTPAPQAVTAAGTYTGNYVTLATGSIQINMQLDSVGADVLTMDTQPKWWLHGTTQGRNVTSSDLEGAPDANGSWTVTGMVDDEYWVEWGWSYEAWPPAAYDATQVTEAAAIGVTLAAPSAKGAWCSAAQTMTGGTIAGPFTGNYQSRATPAPETIALGQDVGSEPYWAGSDLRANWMHGRSGGDTGTNWGNNAANRIWPPDGVTYTATVRAVGPTPGLQTCRVFWEGSGTLTIQDSNTNTVRLGPIAVTDNATGNSLPLATTEGKVGLTFTHPITHGLDPVDTVDGRSYITATGTSGFQNIEIVVDAIVDKGAGDVPLEEQSFRKTTLGSKYVNAPAGSKQTALMGVSRFLADQNDPWPADKEGTYNPSNDSYDTLLFEHPTGRELTDRKGDPGVTPHGFTYAELLQKQIDWCNATGTHFWFNEPWHYNPARLDASIDMIEAPFNENGGGGLARAGDLGVGHPGLKVYYEYSNETWNWGFPQMTYCRYWGGKFTGTDNDPFGNPYPANPYKISTGGTPKAGFDDPGTFPHLLGEEYARIGRRYSAWRVWMGREQWLAKLGPFPSAHYTTLSDRVLIVMATQQAATDHYGIYFHQMPVDGWPWTTGPYVQFEATPNQPGGTNFVDVVDIFAPAFYQKYDLDPGYLKQYTPVADYDGATADPGSGNWRRNTTNTRIEISKTNNDAWDVSARLAELAPGDYLWFQNWNGYGNDRAKYATYNVTAAVDRGTYYELTTTLQGTADFTFGAGEHTATAVTASGIGATVDSEYSQWHTELQSVLQEWIDDSDNNGNQIGNLDGNLKGQYQTLQSFCSTRGLDIYGYEGGEHNFSPNPDTGHPRQVDIQKWYRASHEHERMYGKYRQLFDFCKTYGWKHLNHLTMAGDWDEVAPAGYFPIRETMYDDEAKARKWQAMVDWAYLNPKWW